MTDLGLSLLTLPSRLLALSSPCIYTPPVLGTRFVRDTYSHCLSVYSSISSKEDRHDGVGVQSSPLIVGDILSFQTGNMMVSKLEFLYMQVYMHTQMCTP